MKFIAGAGAAIAISTVGLMTSTSATATVDRQGQAMEEITTVGCLREWKPAESVTSLPVNKQLGMYLLTPIASSPTVAAVVPTYLLTPTLTVNFAAHLDDKVEIVGVPQTAPAPPTVQEIVDAPTPRPEERPSVQSIPRLTVKTLKKISDACPS